MDYLAQVIRDFFGFVIIFASSSFGSNILNSAAAIVAVVAGVAGGIAATRTVRKLRGTRLSAETFAIDALSIDVTDMGLYCVDLLATNNSDDLATITKIEVMVLEALQLKVGIVEASALVVSGSYDIEIAATPTPHTYVTKASQFVPARTADRFVLKVDSADAGILYLLKITVELNNSKHAASTSEIALFVEDIFSTYQIPPPSTLQTFVERAALSNAAASQLFAELHEVTPTSSPGE